MGNKVDEGVPLTSYIFLAKSLCTLAFFFCIFCQQFPVFMLYPPCCMLIAIIQNVDPNWMNKLACTYSNV